MANGSITISDVAEALGVSKTTVSRAISGKGRIGEDTKRRVLEYIEENNYTPNVIAKGLAQSKTYNIGVVMPGNYALMDLPFFQEAILGIQEIAGIAEYDILLCISHEGDASSLGRIVANRKVDGVILLRTFEDDQRISLLKEKNVPFVTTGSTSDKDVMQVDHDHESACRELTSVLLMNNKKIALLGGNEKIVVNRRRLRAFKEAHAMVGKAVDENLIFLNLDNRTDMNRAIEEALERNADCILAMDDAICAQVIRKLRHAHMSIPDEVRVASFYNSLLLENNNPAITAIEFDARELGVMACKNLLSKIDEEEVPSKMLLSYEVVLKESTK